MSNRLTVVTRIIESPTRMQQVRKLLRPGLRATTGSIAKGIFRFANSKRVMLCNRHRSAIAMARAISSCASSIMLRRDGLPLEVFEAGHETGYFTSHLSKHGM